MGKLIDTIVAIATATGRGGVGIVRLSGPLAGRIGERIFEPRKPTSPWPSHQLLYGRAIDSKNGEGIDDGFAVRMDAPHSYTGEEVVEIQTHGSPPALSEIVRLATLHEARLAEPGEFTKRAFLNGKLDLIQAEAVAELIEATSEAEATSARRRLEGKLSSALHRLREETLSLLAATEADIDFPEEELSLPERLAKINKIKEFQLVTNKLLETYESNSRLHEGYSVAFVGRPNVGKSSLFNALLTFDRAIVTSVPGTTRDVLREEVVLDGRRIRFLDTAGLRSAPSDDVERIGMERTTTTIYSADLVCVVAEASEGLNAEEKELLSSIPEGKRWLIWNKIDLSEPRRDESPPAPSFDVSAIRGDGLEHFRQELIERVSRETFLTPEGGVSNDRQKNLLMEYVVGLKRVEEGLERRVSSEFLASDLRHAHRALSRIVGKDEGVEDILTEIFSKFCIGK